MYKYLVLVLLIIIIVSCESASQNMRLPAVSGFFYAGDPMQLSSDVQNLLEKGKQTSIAVSSNLWGFIVPHAGFKYSGQVAGSAYAQLTDRSFAFVVVIAPAHYYRFKGISVGNYQAYQTPLGTVPVASELVAELMSTHELICFHVPAHIKEHSIEVQLPFLQKALKNFMILS